MDKHQKGLSIVDSGLKVEGTFTVGAGTLVVKGDVRGVIDGETMVIAAEGRAVATVRVVSMTIGGLFEGEAMVSGELVILSTGSCTGKVTCRTLTVEKGGLLNAEVTCSGVRGA